MGSLCPTSSGMSGESATAWPLSAAARRAGATAAAATFISPSASSGRTARPDDQRHQSAPTTVPP